MQVGEKEKEYNRSKNVRKKNEQQRQSNLSKDRVKLSEINK